MTDFSLGARLHLGANSRLALSLPQSRCFNPFSPRQLPPQREPRRLPPQPTDLALLSKLGVNAIPCRRYNPSVKTFGFATSPYTGEARTALSCRGENLTQGSREALRERSLRHLNRGAEAAPPQSYIFAAPFPKKKVYKILFYYIMQYDIIQ